MIIKNSAEYFWILLMLSWEKTVPQDKHEEHPDQEPGKSSAIARMAFILSKIALGQEERVFQLLSQHVHKQDGDSSYISKDSSGMKNPYILSNGWFLDSCASIEQKQKILQSLTKLDLSQTLLNIIDEFLAGKSINSQVPSEKETQEILYRSIMIEASKIIDNK